MVSRRYTTSGSPPAVCVAAPGVAAAGALAGVRRPGGRDDGACARRGGEPDRAEAGGAAQHGPARDARGRLTGAPLRVVARTRQL